MEQTTTRRSLNLRLSVLHAAKFSSSSIRWVCLAWELADIGQYFNFTFINFLTYNSAIQVLSLYSASH
ncbi:hypothetical protein CHARACLAT_026520 [Characodon lateralis]|uniref:Uncharacterized protein n=1 Tax=Characodon lateralis TaxID=208331 RepID=A0ABU7DUE3_9TELE|nr:hypothetical protein [Characodon lateralis]